MNGRKSDPIFPRGHTGGPNGGASPISGAGFLSIESTLL